MPADHQAPPQQVAATEYRTRVRHVEAIRYDGSAEARAAILDFMGGSEFASVEKTFVPAGSGLRALVDGISVTSHSTKLRLTVGQWLIRHRHAQGTTYEHMRPGVFERTYEPDQEQL
ncbi:hypothetical protein AB0M87_04660 [Streptomyces sp. NPDC051320]|uniref:hypothetical protein n=1 Tax=Streptomyces sp. NPDC051320 TaxID=3154644 RepID=UPI0034121818